MAPRTRFGRAFDDVELSSRRLLWVLFSVPLCVGLVIFLLDRQMWDIPLPVRILGSTLGAGAVVLLLWADGLLDRVRADPVFVGVGLALVGAFLGALAIPVLNMIALPGASPAATAELPVLSSYNRGIREPRYSRNRIWVGAPLANRIARDFTQVVVSRSPFPPHDMLMLTVDDQQEASQKGCVIAEVRPGLLGLPVAGRASAADCSIWRGRRSADIIWTDRPFEDWQWADQPVGSSKDESP